MKKLKLLLPIVVIAAAAVVVFFLKPWEKKSAAEDVPTLPVEYLVGDESVPALALEEPEGVQAIRAKTVTYTYEGLADSGSTASAYVSQLTGAEPRYFVVDETLMKTDRPDFSTPEGSVFLARAIVAEAAEDESETEDETETEDGPETVQEPEVSRVVTVAISWSEGVCIVVADEAEGVITDPPDPDPVSSLQTMSLLEAVDYLSGLQPAALGLPGSSMDNYEVFALDGAVMVDEKICMRLSIYELDEEGVVSKIAGNYFLSGDGLHLYWLNVDSNTIEELEGVLPY